MRLFLGALTPDMLSEAGRSMRLRAAGLSRSDEVKQWLIHSRRKRMCTARRLQWHNPQKLEPDVKLSGPSLDMTPWH